MTQQSSDMVERVSEYIGTHHNPLHHSSPSVLKEAIEACGATLVSLADRGAISTLKNDEEREEDEREAMRLDERIEEERAALVTERDAYRIAYEEDEDKIEELMEALKSIQHIVTETSRFGTPEARAGYYAEALANIYIVGDKLLLSKIGGEA